MMWYYTDDLMKAAMVVAGWRFSRRYGHEYERQLRPSLICAPKSPLALIRENVLARSLAECSSWKTFPSRSWSRCGAARTFCSRSNGAVAPVR